jgi:hypothetical protein
MVSSFYFARLNMPKFDEYERADRPQFRFVTNADGEYVFADGHRAPVSRAIIIGPTSGRVRAISNCPAQLFGFGLLPAGWAALMGDDAEKLTDPRNRRNGTVRAVDRRGGKHAGTGRGCRGQAGDRQQFCARGADPAAKRRRCGSSVPSMSG